MGIIYVVFEPDSHLLPFGGAVYKYLSCCWWRNRRVWGGQTEAGAIGSGNKRRTGAQGASMELAVFYWSHLHSCDSASLANRQSVFYCPASCPHLLQTPPPSTNCFPGSNFSRPLKERETLTRKTFSIPKTNLNTRPTSGNLERSGKCETHSYWVGLGVAINHNSVVCNPPTASPSTVFIL